MRVFNEIETVVVWHKSCTPLLRKISTILLRFNQDKFLEMENKDVEMVEGVSKTKKRSLDRQCAAYGCYNTFYKTDG